MVLCFHCVDSVESAPGSDQVFECFLSGSRGVLVLCLVPAIGWFGWFGSLFALFLSLRYSAGWHLSWFQDPVVVAGIVLQCLLLVP